MARKRQAKRCTGHRTDGQPCEAWAMRGTTVCGAHGGRAPQVRAAATERLALDAANRLALPVETTAAQALQDGLARANGEVLYLADRVAQIPEGELTWRLARRRTRIQQEPGGMPGNPQIEVTHEERRHALWVAYTDAIARRTAIAAEMARLGIEERRVAIDERTGDLFRLAIEGMLTEFKVLWNLTPVQLAQSGPVIVRNLRRIDAIESGENQPG